MHGVEAPRRAEGIRKLAADMGDLGDRQEGGHGEDGEQRQHGRVEVTGLDPEHTPHHHGEAAEAGRRLDQRGLEREVAVVGEAHAVMVAHESQEHLAPGGLLAEREQLRQPLDRVHRVGVEQAQDFPRLAAQPVQPLAQEEGAEPHQRDEGRERRRRRPAMGQQRRHHRRRHQHRHQRRRHRVGIEILDQLHVLRRHADDVAAAPAQQVGRRELVQLVVERDPHVGQQAEGHVVGDPRFEPVQEAGERAIA